MLPPMTSKRIARPRPFIIRRSEIHGKGAFAIDWIKAGTRLIEYTGERITKAESNRRYPDDEEKPHYTLLFALDDGKTVLEAQRPRTADIGEVPGKGGVDTAK